MLRSAFFLVAVGMAGVAHADILSGERTIFLETTSGARTEIGRVAFTPQGAGSRYAIEWDEGAFADHFLSMRPFKCLEGPDKHWCHVPYPYDIKRSVSPDDLVDLEYDLLFLWKGATEYGINMWNGVYYRLEMEDGRLIGRLNEMDMDTLSAPPDDGNLRPVRDQDLEPGDPDSHWLPRVVIE